MNGQNVNWVADRFGPPADEVDPHSGISDDGQLLAYAACGTHTRWALPADIKAGNVPCLHGCASSAWKAAS